MLFKGVLVMVLLISPNTVISAAPPEIQAVEGYLISSRGPFSGLTQSFEYIRRNVPSDRRSVQLPPILTPDSEPVQDEAGKYHVAHYEFMDTQIYVIASNSWDSSEGLISGRFRWRTNDELCPGRSIQTTSGGSHLAVSMDVTGAAYLILFPDTIFDICRFVDVYQPLVEFFNPDGIQEIPVFPAVLGELP